MPNVKINSSESSANASSNVNNESESLKEVESLKTQIQSLKDMIESLKSSAKESANTNKESVENSNEYVSLTSLFNGTLNLVYGNIVIKFEKFGDTRAIPRDRASECISANMSFFTKGYCYIHDSQIVKLYGLEQLYETLLTDTVMKNITTYSNDDIKSLVSHAPSEQKKILHDMLAVKYANGEVSDLNKLREIDDAIGSKSDDTIIIKGEAIKTLKAMNEESAK